VRDITSSRRGSDAWSSWAGSSVRSEAGSLTVSSGRTSEAGRWSTVRVDSRRADASGRARKTESAGAVVDRSVAAGRRSVRGSSRRTAIPGAVDSARAVVSERSAPRFGRPRSTGGSTVGRGVEGSASGRGVRAGRRRSFVPPGIGSGEETRDCTSTDERGEASRLRRASGRRSGPFAAGSDGSPSPRLGAEKPSRGGA
jgi:hypothetical protein